MNYIIEKSKKIFEGKVFDIQLDEITYDSGNKGRREIIIHNGGAVVIPVKNNGSFILVEQYRYPIEENLLEFPAGKLEPNEDPLICAERELKEETGYLSNNLVKLGSIFTTPGFCTEELHIFKADKLTEGHHNREEGEYGMKVHECSLDEINEMISNGKIKDAKTICALYLLKNINTG